MSRCFDACAVDMDWDGGGSCYSERTVTRARKAHKCVECGAAIPVGTSYHYASGLYESSFFSEHTCLPCAEVRATFSCGGWVFGELWEAIRDQLFREWRHNELLIIECLAKLLTDEAIAKMRGEYAEYVEALDS